MDVCEEEIPELANEEEALLSISLDKWRKCSNTALVKLSTWLELGTIEDEPGESYWNVLEDATNTVWERQQLHIPYDFSLKTRGKTNKFPTPILLVPSLPTMIAFQFFFIIQHLLLIPSFFDVLKFPVKIKIWMINLGQWITNCLPPTIFKLQDRINLL